MRIVQQQRNGYFLLRFLYNLCKLYLLCGPLYDLLYCAQFIPNNSLHSLRRYIHVSVFLLPCVYRKGYAKERVSGSCYLYLSFIKKLLICIAFRKTLYQQIVLGLRSRVKRSIQPKRECLFKTCNNYNAKEPI